MNRAVFYSALPTEALSPTEAERAARLRVPLAYRDGATDAIEERLKKTIHAAMAAVQVPFRKTAEGDLNFDGLFCVKSEALKKSLAGCESAYFLAVTLGMETERFLHRLSILSPAEHFLADALASAYAEAAADFASEILAREYSLTSRFSPGYADLPLSLQPVLLSAVEANKYLHITLKDSFLMLPQKSITAIIGIRCKKGESL